MFIAPTGARTGVNGGVSREWYHERLAALAAWNASAAAEQSLQRTARWTFEKPPRCHLERALER